MFSSPARTGAIALRRERYELAALIRRIVKRDGAAIELQVLQYGVTRQRLSEVIRSGGGWDVVHLSGHGNRAVRTGAARRIHGRWRALPTRCHDLMRPSLRRLKLAVLTSCKSAAEAATDTLRLLGLPVKETGPGTGSAPDHAAGHVSGLARGLAEELGCAVVATRYPVYGDFLTAFNQVFYERMPKRKNKPDGQRQSPRGPAGRSAGRRTGFWRRVSGCRPRESAPPGISAATLGVFGASAAGLVLRAAPADPGPGGAGIGAAAERMAGFPDQAERFVGRDAIMTAASAALRVGSGTTAVLLHGMPGIGKTACVLELAYLCQDQFSAAAFWRPPAGSDPGLILQSLADAAAQLLAKPVQVRVAAPLGRPQWNTYARRLRENMRASNVLRRHRQPRGTTQPGGSWHDARWEAIFDALAWHGGVPAGSR